MGKGYAKGDSGGVLPNVDYKTIVVDGNVDALVTTAESVGKAIKEVKNSQLRGLFASVRQIQLGWDTDPERAYRSAMLLRPRIAYAASRNSLYGLDTVLIESLRQVGGDRQQARRRFMNFVDFFEAIVAYHKASGGKN
jgi:CRISPR-associated protein Csm2